ncbi:hypothetical protein [Paenibacillus protaetiae]|uniref:Uncharacterized protein n=1 Tax=Paenibacillus protaetiae TaxID=2509456 RepID=A0A4V0YEQ3_9BACL|nr:hypothetical protein [Paenibacillus protaetiae]QAY65011.1 hypothetical protein ET464_00035 [Paenibacillus protaetiae]
MKGELTYKKLVATVLSVSLFVGGVVIPAQVKASPSNVESSERVLALEKHPGDTHLVYTYESNGSLYKVEENANEDLTEVNSTIYVMNDEGNYVQYATQEADIINSNLIVTTNVNGVIDTEA